MTIERSATSMYAGSPAPLTGRHDGIAPDQHSSVRAGSPALACAALVLVPYLLVLIGGGYLPAGIDEVVQLEAAGRMARGLGYTVAFLRPADLSTPGSNYLVSWPAGYSLLVALGLRLGCSLAAAALLVKIATLAAAVVGWSALATRFVRHRALNMAFGAFVGFFVTVFASASSDLVVLALFPFLSLQCLSYGDGVGGDAGSNADVGAFRRLVGAGLLAGVAVAMKYSALPLAVVGATWIAWLNRRHLLSGLKDLVAFGAPALSIVASIFIRNTVKSGSYSYVATVHRAPAWHMGWLLDWMSGLFLDATYLPRIAIRMLRQAGSVGPATSFAVVAIVIQLAVTIGAIHTLLRLDGRRRRLAAWLIISTLSIVGFLLLATSLVFAPRPDADWSHLKEGRYYLSIIPLIVLCVATAVAPFFERRSEGRARSERMLATGIVATCVLAVTGYAVYSYQVTRAVMVDSRAAYEAVQTITSGSGDPVVVLVDTYNYKSLEWVGPLKSYSGIDALRDATFSRETLVALVCTTFDIRQSAQGTDRCTTEGFTAVAQNGFSARHVGPNDMLYWRIYPPTHLVESLSGTASRR